MIQIDELFQKVSPFVIEKPIEAPEPQKKVLPFVEEGEPKRDLELVENTALKNTTSANLDRLTTTEKALLWAELATKKNNGIPLTFEQEKIFAELDPK